MITKIKLENYRSYREAEFPLKPLTALIGPVGGGKSNFFKALVLLKNIVSRDWNEIFPSQGFRWTRNRLAKETDPIGFEVEIDELVDYPEEKARYLIQIAEGPNGIYVVREELIRISPGIPETWIFRRDKHGGKAYRLGDFEPFDASILTRSKNIFIDPDTRELQVRYGYVTPGQKTNDEVELKFIKNVADSLDSLWYYHLEASKLKEPGEGQENHIVRSFGDKLPDFWAWLRNNDSNGSAISSIENDLKEILPDFQKVFLSRINPDSQSIFMSFEHNKRPYDISANDLSDGTMFVLGLLCIVRHPLKRRMICIEEPETGLHPRLMRWLLDKFVGLSYPDEKDKRVQVILSTHSPYFLDLFAEMQDSVLVIEQKEGESKATPLVEIQRMLRITGDTGVPLGYEWASGLFEGLR